MTNHLKFINYAHDLASRNLGKTFPNPSVGCIIAKNNKITENVFPTIISSWKSHYNSWKKVNKNYLLIKYENLLNNPETEFKKVSR